jgi:hypothetical protein
MRKNTPFALLIVFSLVLFSGCGMNFGGSGDPGQKDGPGSGEEGDIAEEPQGPDSGEDYDTTIPGLPDSGDEVEPSPDSGDEVDTEGQPDGPGSGPDGDMPEEPEEDEGQDDDDESDEPTSPDSGEEIDLEHPNGPDSGEDYTVRGSCNAIGEGSTCVEYVGSFWTKENARLNCSSASAFSTSACPRPVLGGCRIGAGSATEIITWHYSYGGDPYTEVIQYATMSCNALPGGQWTN